MNQIEQRGVFWAGLRMAWALVRRRWLQLVVVSLLLGLAGPAANAWLGDATGAMPDPAGKIADWLGGSAVQAVFVLSLLATVRPWPIEGDPRAAWARWLVILFVMQAVIDAPELIPLTPGGDGSGVSIAVSPAGEMTSVDRTPSGEIALKALGAALAYVLLLGALALAPAAVVLENRSLVPAVRRSLGCLRRAWPSLLVFGAAASGVLTVVMLGAMTLGSPSNLAPGKGMDLPGTLSTVLGTLFCAGILLRIRVLTEPQPELTAEVFD